MSKPKSTVAERPWQAHRRSSRRRFLWTHIRQRPILLPNARNAARPAKLQPNSLQPVESRKDSRLLGLSFRLIQRNCGTSRVIVRELSNRRPKTSKSQIGLSKPPMAATSNVSDIRTSRKTANGRPPIPKTNLPSQNRYSKNGRLSSSNGVH